MLIEALTPIRIRLPSGRVVLTPGHPMHFSEEDGRKLLAKVPDEVRVVPDAAVTIEPTVKPDGSPLSLVYWQRHDQIVGPGVPEFVLKDGNTFWIAVAFQQQPVFVNAEQLRSRRQFEIQQRLKPTELMKDFVHDCKAHWKRRNQAPHRNCE